ncbi:MAG TPA: T9SS type A sorting domain-containing protein, partial [Flavisolibacter sp.]
GYYAEFRVKRFSEFWLNNGGFDQGTPLPVKLLQFTAEKTSGLDVVVQWDVASQTLVNRYEVELALTEADVLSNNFVKIGEVAAVPGTGNLHYEFTDTDPAKFATRYYRLKIVNQDGSFQYSAIRSVTFADAVLEQVYPNPSTGKFFLVYQLNPNERITARVYDAKARLVKVITFTGTGMSQKFEIDLSQEVYATGVYLLHINLGSGTRTYKLYKE